MAPQRNQHTTRALKIDTEPIKVSLSWSFADNDHSIDQESNLSERIRLSNQLLAAIASTEQVSGLTHRFYRYPARFSPEFARAAIEEFSEPGGVVVDPFMGGGTTAVEALAIGRRFIGTDISRLALFVSQAKTTRVPRWQLERVKSWFADFAGAGAALKTDDRTRAFQAEVPNLGAEPLRETIGEALAGVDDFIGPSQRRFARAVVLRAGQTALDTRRSPPDPATFRTRLQERAEEMSRDLLRFHHRCREARSGLAVRGDWKVLRAASAETLPELVESDRQPPSLILTSPPYPGVHVLYHRWQVSGGRETPAPFWIADVQDGHGPSHYTLGDRHNETAYFEQLTRIFRQVRQICGIGTTVVQVVAFRDASRQLPRYLEAMRSSGFRELSPSRQSADRVTREVPNRRWYAARRERTSDSATEFVLFHRPD